MELNLPRSALSISSVNACTWTHSLFRAYQSMGGRKTHIGEVEEEEQSKRQCCCQGVSWVYPSPKAGVICCVPSSDWFKGVLGWWKRSVTEAVSLVEF